MSVQALWALHALSQRLRSGHGHAPRFIYRHVGQIWLKSLVCGGPVDITVGSFAEGTGHLVPRAGGGRPTCRRAEGATPGAAAGGVAVRLLSAV